ncbi:MAG: DUF3800 domain-containing protein [Verrucomicrobiales bacterium]
MKVCYVDESGNNDADPCLVMVGLQVDAARLNKTETEFAGIFGKIEALFKENLQELKGAKLILGRDRWRNVDPVVRKQITQHLIDWVSERKHALFLSAIVRTKHRARQGNGLPSCCGDVWLSAGLHIALQVQKVNQTQKSNKGHTFLVFDDNKKKAELFAELLWNPPVWTDDYYDKGKKQDRLDQVIDTAFTVRSQHASLVQVADLYAFMFRPGPNSRWSPHALGFRPAAHLPQE